MALRTTEAFLEWSWASSWQWCHQDYRSLQNPHSAKTPNFRHPRHFPRQFCPYPYSLLYFCHSLPRPSSCTPASSPTLRGNPPPTSSYPRNTVSSFHRPTSRTVSCPNPTSVSTSPRQFVWFLPHGSRCATLKSGLFFSCRRKRNSGTDSSACGRFWIANVSYALPCYCSLYQSLVELCCLRISPSKE